MNLKITQLTPRLTELGIEKDNLYEVDEDQPIVTDMYKIRVPKRQKGKYRFALISEDEGELVED